jgi:hypothetical protein
VRTTTTPSTHEEAWNIRLVGHSDLNGHGDCMHVNLKDGFAFVGHMGESRVGTSVVDVSDPTRPRVATQLETPTGTHSHKVQVVGDVLLVNHERSGFEPQARDWRAGLKVYDVSRPAQPREIGFLPTPGKGVHRMTYWEPPYAYISGSDAGYIDQFFIAVDLSDPTQPREVGRWWFPGQHAAGGETPSWVPSEGHRGGFPSTKRYALHHALVRGQRAYCGWWDAGLVILDIANLGKPTLVSQLDFGSDVSHATHTACPVPGRDLVVVTDEEVDFDCTGLPKQVRMVDIADERNPRVIATFPRPEGDYCARGGRFGPHNVHEMRPGTLVDPNTVYVSYFNAGLRVYDVADARQPREIAAYVPSPPPGRASIQFNDLLVGPDGLIYITDRHTGGLYILERTGRF